MFSPKLLFLIRSLYDKQVLNMGITLVTFPLESCLLAQKELKKSSGTKRAKKILVFIVIPIEKKNVKDRSQILR